jgi:hypothetical protein
MSFWLSPLLAFEFASPLLLWGLALGGLPLLIHLLNKRKFRETQWAAMRFLLEAVRKNSRRMRIEQLILLAVRTLILVLLVLALARPSFEKLGLYFRADVPVHKIIVLDTSFSMGFEPGGQARFQQAQDIARQIALESRQGDALNLVRISGSEPRVIVGKPAFQPAEVIQEIDQLRLPHERGEVYPSLVEITKLLQLAPEIRSKEVYFITDLQRVSWIPDAGGRPAEIRNLLKGIGDAARLVVIDLGQTASRNNAITDFRAIDPFVTVGTPARFKVAATTFGNAPQTGQTLELLVDGKLQQQTQVDLQPSSEVLAYFTHTFSTGGEHRLQVRLAADELNVDNLRQLVVPVKEEVRALCVNGKLAGEARGNATYNLELALAPATRDQPSPSLIHPKVIKYGELRGVDLTQYDCVFLCNVSSFDPGEAEILESYLKSGGGVIWCLGDRVQAENYNRLLYRDGQGILPAKIGERRGNAETRATAFGFDAPDFTHPIVKEFQGNPDAGLKTTRTYEYFKTTLAPNSRARIPLSFDSGDPAIVESQVEAGRAILVTTAVDDSWGNWALWPSFVPLMQEMTFYAVSGRSGERQSLVGEPLVQAVHSRGAEISGSITRPDGETDAPRVTQGAHLSDFIYEKADLSGFYEIQYGAPLSRTESFAVNVDPRESNLTKLEKEELDQDLLPGTEFTYRTDWEEMERHATGPANERGGITRWLLYLTLYLLFVEQMLAWNFVYGLWLLCPPLLPLMWLTSRGRPPRI